jgi:hypothetical protein
MLNSPVWRGKPRYAFMLGLILGGVAAAAALLIFGSLLRLPLPSTAWSALVAVLMVMVALREFDVATFWLPENKRLVPEHVDRYGRFFGPLQFGLEMGTGMRTYLPTGLPHVLAISVALLASPMLALTAGMGFGIGRASMTQANLQFSDDNSWDIAWLNSYRTIRVLLVAAFCLACGFVLF